MLCIAFQVFANTNTFQEIVNTISFQVRSTFRSAKQIIVVSKKMNINEALEKLKKSPFRSKFHLSNKDIEYINEKGLDKIREHAFDFISKRLAPEYIANDGEQTPMRGHPVFIAQHACACCCRGCLNKWYKVKKDVALTDVQQEKIVNLLMSWIEREYYGKITNN